MVRAGWPKRGRWRFVLLGVDMVAVLPVAGVRGVRGSARRDALAGWALPLMLFDHVAVLVTPWVSGLAEVWLRVPGRLVMPIFALLTASAVSAWSGGDGARPYLRRLFWLAVVSEVPYWLYFGHPVNAVYALWVGAVALWGIQGRRWPVSLFVLGLFALWCAGTGQGFEFAYALLVVLLGFRSSVLGLVAAFGAVLFLNPGAFYASLTAGALALVLWCPVPGFARLPRWFRYGFYPVHLALLELVRALV